ncbi:non-specific lipid transfer protein GPI-anchored 14-like isoform X1 [Arachis duranensis]|uniref:Non-specific lipid transfer protein GPI-anchored 14-like isoform X1 n=1 Tax=Arachis duranensis TaxID=130453 RepID=A0A9C6TYP1_ARADU|nr:non-specific lipid transfer protein GPI-anchored 14-like isoform X1 [Arachis duranensis]
MKMASTSPMLVLITPIMLMLIHNAMGDTAQEKQKCVEQLNGIATCLPYVGGDAKSPTADCCSGIIEAIKNKKKCVCLIIKDRDDPDLGLKVNLTLALALPSLCKAPDNLSQCPALLHLDPKSAEAQAFNQLGQNSNGGSNSTSPSPHPPGDDPFKTILSFYFCNIVFSFSKFGFTWKRFEFHCVYLTVGETTASTHTLPTNNGASYKGKVLLQTLVAELLVFFSLAHIVQQDSCNVET